MANKISKTDFVFLTSGFGRYRVTYTSPTTGKSWTAHITDMEAVDMVKNTPTPRVKDLEVLKGMCKRGNNTAC